jgi:formate dehydrogenase iron-sulfur subunit
MLRAAEERLSRYPDQYIQRIYGKEEAGGTSVLYLSRLPFEELGFRQVTQRPLPDYTWQVLRLVPGVFITVGGTLAAISWINHRKERLRKEEEEQTAKFGEKKED